MTTAMTMHTPPAAACTSLPTTLAHQLPQHPPQQTTCTLAELLHMLAVNGQERQPGEPISLLEHALQRATLAQQAGAGVALTVAALLHGVGRLLLNNTRPGTPAAHRVHPEHTWLAEQALLPLLGPEVSRPVGLHGLARRYLAANPAYAKELSSESLRSLALEGGPLDLEACFQFRQLRHAMDAVRLCHWDEAARHPGMPTPDLAHFSHLATTLASRLDSQHTHRPTHPLH